MAQETRPPPDRPEPKTKRAARRIALGLALAIPAIAFAAPYAAVAHGTARATSCLAAYEAPRPAAPPACEGEIEWLVTPSHLPWTRDAASYRGEELGARIAVADYRDAIVGLPDEGRIKQAAAALERATQVVQRGSMRVALDDLGPDIGAPNLGRSADDLGDRATLLDRPDRFLDWHVRLHALHAALLQGDAPLALTIAKRFAEFDPRDEDLRTSVAAVLCLGGDAKRGIELLTTIQADRAARRYAAMARDWGDVRALLIACAARAGVLPPARPENPEAGQGIPMASRALLRLRLAKAAPDNAAEERERDAAAEGALRLLLESARTSEDPADASAAIELRVSGARAAILASVLASGYRRLPPSRLIALAEPALASGEGPFLPSPAATALDWMLEPARVGPVVPASTYELAAERARAMAQGSGEDALPSEGEAEPLARVSSALFIEAAKAYARAGDGASSMRAIDRSGLTALGSDAAVALARSSAWYVIGDVEAALAELDADPDLLSASRVGADAEAQAPSAPKAVFAAALIQRAELLAMLPGEDPEASAKAAAGAALAADRAAESAADPALDARARFLRLALVRPSDAPPLRPGTEVDIQGRLSAALASRSPLDAHGNPERPLLHKGTGPDRPWPWVGTAHPGTLSAILPPPSAPALATSLALWDAARRAPADERRALRYMVLRARGDASSASLSKLALAAGLLGDAGDAEIWLDAFTAQDARVLSHRAYTWLRAHAARLRGDEPSARRWLRAYEELCSIASDPDRAEIARFLGL